MKATAKTETKITGVTLELTREEALLLQGFCNVITSREAERLLTLHNEVTIGQKVNVKDGWNFVTGLWQQLALAGVT